MPEYICEVCDKTETLDEQEAFDAGWDYPPFIGAWGVISPRTCPGCDMMDTLWWALVNRTNPEDLSDRHKTTALRILKEVEQ